jgi:hypothetical protein
MPRPVVIASRIRMGALGILLPRALRAACCLSMMAIPAHAGDVSLTAIALFDGPGGAAYAQITAVTLNRKTELRSCADATKISRSTYGKLPRVQLKGATSLEVNADGGLVLTIDKTSLCVVPSNLHFEKNIELTPAEVARQATLQGTILSASSSQGSELPALKPGLRLVFVPGADTELAEFLRAQRARSTVVWQDFLSRYASSSHVPDGKKALAALYEQSAESELSLYRQSVATHKPDRSYLKRSREQAEQAANAVSVDLRALKLMEQINGELDALTQLNRAEFRTYQTGLLDHSAKHAQFTAAKQHNYEILEVNAKYSPALALEAELFKEATGFEATLSSAERLLEVKRYDEAFTALGPYRFFAPEVPRIETVVAAVYTFHFSRGVQSGEKQDWEVAVREFGKAVETRTDSQEAGAALKNAKVQFTNQLNQATADQASEQSKTYAAQNLYVEAYEVLAELSPEQRPLVADQLEQLKPNYVTAAYQRVQTIEGVHIPIRGRADEDALRQAYDLLTRVGALSVDPAIALKLDLLSDKISAYYVEQATRYLEKPLASGVGVGWCYLGEARRYKHSLAAVKDLMTRYESAYQLRAKLSLGVTFRDQTSRRESVGFADQLADAIATDLESSGLPVKVVRRPDDSANALQPSFLLIGEINSHRTVRNSTVETLQSKYRAGTREVKNETWLKVNREYDGAQQEGLAAQHSLDEASFRNNKKDMAAATIALAAARKRIDETHNKLDAIEQTRPQDVIEPYNYTKRNIDLAAVIELAFRITDLDGNLTEPTMPLKQESHKTYAVLENVKAEDTEGVTDQGTAPDEIQFMTDLEIQARDILIQAVHERVSRLPGKILEEARKRVLRDDLDGAAEKYILYLNTTPDASSSEREEAIKFLRDHFNVGLASIT